MDDERVKLLIDFGLSEEHARKLTTQLDKMKESARGVADSYEVLDRVTGTYAVATNKVQEASDKAVRSAVEQTQAQKLMRQMLEETAHAADTVTVSTSNLVGTKAAGGRGVLGVSYAFQDFMSVLTMGGGLDRALMSITNNFDQMAMAAGASVGQAAKMSLLFTGFVSALPILIPLLKQMWEAFGGGVEGPEPVVKALDAAEERLKRIRAELEKILAAATPEERDTSKLVAEFLEGGQGRQVVGGVAGALAVSGRGEQMTAEEQAATSDVAVEAAVRNAQMAASMRGERFGAAEAAAVRASAQRRQQEARDAAQERINRANVQAAGKIVGAAPTERGARDTLRALARQFPGQFPGGLAADIEAMSTLEPEAIREQEEQARRDAEFAERAKAGVEGRRQAAKRQRERDRQTDRLNLAGQTQEEQARRQQERQAAKDERQAAKDEKAEAKAQRDKFRAGTPSAAELRRGDIELLQRDAMRLETQAQRGGMTPRIAARLQRLQERLGRDMPTFQETQTIQNMVQQQLISNQATTGQALQAARRNLAMARRVGRALEMPPDMGFMPR